MHWYHDFDDTDDHIIMMMIDIGQVCLGESLARVELFLFFTALVRLGRYQKKTGLCGKNSQAADPPTHPPSLGNPCYQKKSWVYFSF